MGLWVKVCGITRVEDARMVEKAGADAMGLIFSEASPRYVSLERASEICSALSSRVQKVGVFVRPEWDRLGEVLDRLPLDIIQWHGGPLTRNEYARLSAFGLPWIHVIRWGGELPLEAPPGASRLLVEGRSEKGLGGTGESWDYKSLSSIRWPLPLILSGGLAPGTVKGALASLSPSVPFGVDVSSGVESQPGRKDEKKVGEFLEQVRSFEEKA